MSLRVRTTRQCDIDIINIYGYGVTAFGVAQAERYHEGLMASFDLLTRHPRMARERSEFTPPVRLHPYRSHMIVYLATAGDVLIVRVLHGRQDWERHLA